MKSFRTFLYLGAFFVAAGLHAQIDLSVSSIETKSKKSLVTFETRNRFEQGVRDARAWVFLFDSDGKIVGNRAHWVVGGDSEAKELFKSDEERQFALAVETSARPVSAKVIFTKIILEDGRSINPRKAMATDTEETQQK